jgi:hypothetical protein
MRKIRPIVLTLAALICFAAAYRFASHGIRLNDTKCIGLACLAVLVGAVLMWLGFAKKKRQHG